MAHRRLDVHPVHLAHHPPILALAPGEREGVDAVAMQQVRRFGDAAPGVQADEVADGEAADGAGAAAQRVLGTIP